MMLQMSATPVSSDMRSEPPLHAVSGKSSCPRPAWHNARLQAFMSPERDGVPELGALASQPMDEDFREAISGTLKAGEMLQLPETMIVAVNADVVIEPTEEGCVVTGTRGRNNECRLIFRHAYRRVSCHLRVPNGAAEARITFLRSPSQKSPALVELQSFNICPPHLRQANGAGGFSMTIDYDADPLNEVQGILWRGGLLQISRVSLTP